MMKIRNAAADNLNSSQNWRGNSFISCLLYLFSICIIFTSCEAVHFYAEPDAPKWFSNENSNQGNASDSLLIISFNIQYSEEIDLAIDELQQLVENSQSLVIFLQEMDEEGVEKIADALSLNYLYYPATKRPETARNFGNAILSKLPLQECRKLILPHEIRTNKQRRIATSAIVELGGKRLLLYSLHLHTTQMRLSKRLDQVAFIIADLIDRRSDVDAILVGGDFNSLRKKDRSEMSQLFKEANMEWQTKRIGGTSSAFFGLIKPSIDHFFSWGLKSGTIGIISDSKASDHLPIYLLTSFKD